MSAKKKSSTRTVRKLPNYKPHVFRTKEESAKEYEQLADYELKIAKGYTESANSDPAAQRHPALRAQWRREAKKHLLRAKKAQDAARRMHSLGSSRDPQTKSLLWLHANKKRTTMSRENQAYELREIESFQRQLREVEKLPLQERKENAREFTEVLHNDPRLIAERIGWLLNGSYGRGSYTKALQVANSPRMNQGAWLVQTVAALEWSVPGRMTAQAWHTLSVPQRSRLDILIKEEIRNSLSESR